MKTLKINIKGKFQDGYLYGGQLFLVENSGEIKAINLWTVISQNLKYNSDEYHFFKLVFTQNNWLSNGQASNFLGISKFKKDFKLIWETYSKNEYIFYIPESKELLLGKIENTPIFDFHLYGMRMYAGNREGLYEAPISINDQNFVSLNNSIQRVFDARTTQISAKSGSIIVSSNTEGLFHGQLKDYNSHVTIKEKPISAKSIRTSWSGFDLINYETHHNFNYLKSEYSSTEERNYLYSKEDESSRKISIDLIGEKSYPLKELISGFKFEESEIIYSFNSSDSCYFFLKNGEFFHTYFRKNNKIDDVRLSSRIYKLPNGEKKNNIAVKPISAKSIYNGSIIEYYDKVLLIKNNKKTILENKPVTAIKTFPSSLRYKNVIAIFDGEGVSIHSIFPFEI